MKRRNFIGLTAAASVSTVRAASGDKPLLTFGLICDVQYADAEPQGERHYRASPAKLKAAVEWLSKKDLPFTLHLGDLIDRDFNSFATVLPLLNGLGHPVRHLLGNHDYTVAEGDKSRVVATLGMPADYYRFDSGGVRLLMLDTNDLSTYKHPQGSQLDLESEALLERLVAENRSGAKPYNGGISVDQLAWLDRELTDADAAGARVILCGHHPLLPGDGHQAWNWDGVLEVIDRHRSVTAYFNGHFHDGAEIIRNGVHYITFKSLLHEPGVNAWSAIRIFGDRLEIEGNGREASRVIKLT